MTVEIFIELLLASSLLIYPLTIAIFVVKKHHATLLDIILVVWPANLGLGVFITYFLGATEWFSGTTNNRIAYLGFHLFFLGVLSAKLACRRQPLKGMVDRIENSVWSSRSNLYRTWMWALVIMSTILRLDGFIRYGAVVSGMQLGGDVSYLEFAFMTVVGVLEPLGIAVTAHVIARNSAKLWEKICCAGLLLFFQLLEGRAPFLTALFVGFYFWIKVRGRINRNMIGFGALSFIVTFLFIFPYFKTFQYSIRDQQAVGTKVGNDDVVESVGKVFRGELTNSSSVTEFNRLDLGSSGRFYWLHWNTIVVDGVEQSGPLLGRAAIEDISYVLPRFLKGNLTETDNFIQTNLGLPLFDATTNLVAIAYADFGLAGCLVYGLLFPLLILFVAAGLCSAFSGHPLICMLIYVFTVKAFFNFENCFSLSLIPYRSILLVAVLLFPLAWSEAKKLRIGSELSRSPRRRLEEGNS